MDKIEKHNKIIALNILYISRNTKKISVVIDQNVTIRVKSK